MTARAEAAPRRAVIQQRARAAAGLPRAAAVLLATLRRLVRAGPPNAAGLTDRQLADVGLMRADLPDHRGWRR